MSETNLEKLIKLNYPFSNEYYKGVVGIMLLETIILKDLEDYLKKYQLTYQQFNILRILKGQHPKTTQLNLLKERMLHKQSDVSRLVDRLFAMGLVEKRLNEFNKRKLAITLSEKGTELINTIDLNDVEFKSITRGLKTNEICEFNNLISRMLGFHMNRSTNTE